MADGWIPEPYFDEVVPEPKASPSDWIGRMDDGAPALLDFDGEVAERLLTDGERVDFYESRAFGGATLTIADDGSWSVDREMPAGANLVSCSDIEASADSTAILIKDANEAASEWAAASSPAPTTSSRTGTGRSRRHSASTPPAAASSRRSPPMSDLTTKAGRAYYNEIDPYAAQWLRNLIAGGHIAPGDVDERSIVDVRPADLVGYTQCHFFAGIGGWSYAARLAGWPDDKPLWTGSCPCQPFSVAGKQEGQADDRHLWPVLFDLIRACKPSTRGR